MKRFLSLVLAIALVFSSFTIICKAAQVNEYSNSSYDADAYYETAYTLYDGFMTGPCWAGYLADKKNFVYTQVKDKLADNGYFQACLSAAEFLTNAGWADLFKGEYDADDVKVQYYVTALCSLLMTMEDNWENIRASQSKVDATMAWNEYAAEGASAVAGLLAENTNGIWKTAFTICGINVDIIGNAIDTVEDYQSLEAGATTFLMYHTLLETIINNTSDDIMSQAAKHLLKVTDLSYTYRMNYLDTTLNAESDYFFSVLDKVLEDAEKSGALSPEEFAALGCMNKAAGLGGSFKVGIDIGKFVMDAMIHSSDTILRYYEMCAMASVRDALIIEITKKNSGILGQQDWEEILTVRDLLMDLLYVNVRGEYCAYNLLAKDAGLISSVHNIFNGKEDIEWIRGVLSIADNLQRTIKGFFPDWEDYKYDTISQSENIDIEIVDLLLSHEKMWGDQIYKAEPDFERTFFDFSQFAYFHDFDFDGIPEFVIQSNATSSAHFTDRVIYKVQGNSLQPIQAGGWDDFEVRKNTETGTYFHIGHDYSYINAGDQYVGWTENRYAKVSLMSDSLISEQIYAVYQDTSNAENIDYYGSVINVSISKGEYDRILQELEDTTINLGFETGNLIETWDFSVSYEDKKKILLDAYHSAFKAVEKQTHEQKISEDDAYQIACKYWDYTPGDVDEETGFDLSVSPPSLNTDENTGKLYYYVMLRWWVEDPNFPHASTVDWVYIDAETGACSFDTP